jgi:integrase
MANLAVSRSALAVPVDRAAEERLSALRADATPVKTNATYTSHWNCFVDWCEDTGKKALPASADTLAHYVSYMNERGLAVSTVGVALAAIARKHKQQNAYSERHDPIVEEAFAGMARRQRGRAEAKRDALTADLLEKVVTALPRTFTGTRDRAILLLGFVTAMRSDELVRVEVANVKFESRAQGTVFIEWGKTDQKAEGAFVPIYRAKKPAMCPMQALRDWTIAAGIRSGPLFRRIDRWDNLAVQRLDAQAVCGIVQRACQRAGLAPIQFGWGSHSLRAGFVTSAARAGVPLEVIMRTTRHKNINTLLGYVREIKAMENGAGRDLL